MKLETPAELATISALVSSAALADECKASIVWCLSKLTPLYTQFTQTYDSRFTGEIVRLETGILQKLTQEPKTSVDAATVTKAILENLRTLHERHGLPQLEVKQVKQTKPRKPRKVA